MPRGAVPGWVQPEPVQGDTPEERARFECARQGIPFEPTPEQMEMVDRLIMRAEEQLARANEAARARAEAAARR